MVHTPPGSNPQPPPEAPYSPNHVRTPLGLHAGILSATAPAQGGWKMSKFAGVQSKVAAHMAWPQGKAPHKEGVSVAAAKQRQQRQQQQARR